MYEDEDGDRSYGRRQWDASYDSATRTAVHHVIDMYCSGSKRGRYDAGDRRPWERLMDNIIQRLNEDSRFHRPPAKTDRLYAVLEPGTDAVLIKHPVPDPGYEYMYRENLPNIRCGTIASGRVVARNALWRTEVKLAVVVINSF